jgi:hypothetical protein
MVDWAAAGEAILALLTAPLTVVVIGAGLSALLAYYVTVRLYRPQKVFEAKQRIYPAIVGAIQEFRRDVPKIQGAMRRFHGPTKVPDLAGLDSEAAGKAVMDAVLPRLGYSFEVLEAITEMDPGSELAARAAVLAGDVGNDHQMELMYHLYGAFMTATSRATRVLSVSMAELWMFEHPTPLVKVIDELMAEANGATKITVSSGGKKDLDWRRFDALLGTLQNLISVDIGQSARLWANAPGLNWESVGIPKELGASASGASSDAHDSGKGPN